MRKPHQSYGFLSENEFQELKIMPDGAEYQLRKKQLMRCASARKAALTRMTKKERVQSA
jgi:hypothetical protein